MKVISLLFLKTEVVRFNFYFLYVYLPECWKVDAGHFWDRSQQGLGSTDRQDHESLQDDRQENVSLPLFPLHNSSSFVLSAEAGRWCSVSLLSTGGSPCPRCDSSRSCQRKWSRRSRRRTSPLSVSMTSTTMRLVSFLPSNHMGPECPPQTGA